MSPGAAHTVSVDTNSDADSVSGIGPGSFLAYMLYSSVNGTNGLTGPEGMTGTGGCHTEAEHRAIFEAVRASLAPCPDADAQIDDGMCIESASSRADIMATVVNPYSIVGSSDLLPA